MSLLFRKWRQRWTALRESLLRMVNVHHRSFSASLLWFSDRICRHVILLRAVRMVWRSCFLVYIREQSRLSAEDTVGGFLKWNSKWRKCSWIPEITHLTWHLNAKFSGGWSFAFWTTVAPNACSDALVLLWTSALLVLFRYRSSPFSFQYFKIHL